LINKRLTVLTLPNNLYYVKAARKTGEKMKNDSEHPHAQFFCVSIGGDAPVRNTLTPVEYLPRLFQITAPITGPVLS